MNNQPAVSASKEMGHAQSPPSTGLLSVALWICLALSTLFLCTGLYLLTEYRSDVRELRQFAQQHVDVGQLPSQIIQTLNKAVYDTQGFAKNRGYFLWPALGPTPVQVLHEGGDCADKSRLLAALLRELGIPSTLVMLYPCSDCQPNHTVVEARYEAGWMVADPVFDIVFPALGGGYHGVSKLSAGSSILSTRLRELALERGPGDKINHYATDLIYNHPRTINFDKNGLMRSAAWMLRQFDIDSYRIPRPHLLENPKLVLLQGAVVGFVLFLAAALGFQWLIRWRDGVAGRSLT